MIAVFCACADIRIRDSSRTFSTSMILGCLRPPMMFISRDRNFSRNSLVAKLWSTIFTARSRAVGRCTTFLTTANDPLPSLSPRRYPFFRNIISRLIVPSMCVIVDPGLRLHGNSQKLRLISGVTCDLATSVSPAPTASILCFPNLLDGETRLPETRLRWYGRTPGFRLQSAYLLPKQLNSVVFDSTASLVSLTNIFFWIRRLAMRAIRWWFFDFSVLFAFTSRWAVHVASNVRLWRGALALDDSDLLPSCPAV